MLCSGLEDSGTDEKGFGGQLHRRCAMTPRAVPNCPFLNPSELQLVARLRYMCTRLSSYNNNGNSTVDRFRSGFVVLLYHINLTTT